MAKKRRGMSPEEWARYRERSAEIDRMLEERLAYHAAKLAEERAARERAEAREQARRLRRRRLLRFVTPRRS